jgi:hypothetical protein
MFLLSLVARSRLLKTKSYRYLLVIPSRIPDVDIDDSPWVPPFTSTILDRLDIKLKAIIIAGQSDKLAIHLHYNYRPCSADACALMNAIHIMRGATRTQYFSCIIRPAFGKPEEADDAEMTDDMIGDLFHQLEDGHHSIRGVIAAPFWDVRVVLPLKAATDGPMSPIYLCRLHINIMAMQRFAAWGTLRLVPDQPVMMEAKGPTRGYKNLPPLDCVVVGVDVEQAMLVAKVVRPSHLILRQKLTLTCHR